MYKLFVRSYLLLIDGRDLLTLPTSLECDYFIIPVYSVSSEQIRIKQWTEMRTVINACNLLSSFFSCQMTFAERVCKLLSCVDVTGWLMVEGEVSASQAASWWHQVFYPSVPDIASTLKHRSVLNGGRHHKVHVICNCPCQILSTAMFSYLYILLISYQLIYLVV